MDTLGEVLARRVNAHWKVLLTDACHSGKINPETSNESVDAQFAKLPKDFLTEPPPLPVKKAMKTQGCLPASASSLFSGAGLAGKRRQRPLRWRDYRLGVSRVCSLQRSPVRQGEPRLPDAPRKRGLRTHHAPRHAPRCVGAGRSAPSMQGTAVIEANMDDVKIYVDGNLVGTVCRQTAHGSRPGSGPHTVEGVRQGYEPITKPS